MHSWKSRKNNPLYRGRVEYVFTINRTDASHEKKVFLPDEGHAYTVAHKMTITIGNKIIIEKNPSNFIVKELDMNVKSIKFTCISDKECMENNIISNYEYADWKPNIPKDIADKSYFPSIGDTIYTIFSLTDNILFLGDSMLNTNSPDERLEKLMTTKLIKE